MNLEDVKLMLQRGWLIVLVLAGLGAYEGKSLAAQKPVVYTSFAQAYVVVNNSGNSGGDAFNAGQAAQAKMASYVTLAKSYSVLKAVIDTLHLAMSTEQLANRLTVQFAPGTLLIDITAVGHDVPEALDIVNEEMQQLANEIQELETPAPGVPAWTRLIPTVTSTPPQASKPPTSKYMGMGATGGVLLGALIAFLWVRLDSRLRTKEQLQAVFGTGLVPAEDLNAIRAKVLAVSGDSPLVTVSGVRANSWPTTRRLADRLAATNASVLVIDARAKLSGATAQRGLAQSEGFAELLRGEAEASTLPSAAKGAVAVLPSGTGRADLVDLLASSAAPAVISRAAEGYDHVLVDGVGPTTRASIPKAAQLLVVKAGKASAEGYRSESGVATGSPEPRIVALVPRTTLLTLLAGLVRRVRERQGKAS